MKLLVCANRNDVVAILPCFNPQFPNHQVKRTSIDAITGWRYLPDDVGHDGWRGSDH
jgi:hypothetical protein